MKTVVRRYVTCSFPVQIRVGSSSVDQRDRSREKRGEEEEEERGKKKERKDEDEREDLEIQRRDLAFRRIFVPDYRSDRRAQMGEQAALVAPFVLRLQLIPRNDSKLREPAPLWYRSNASRRDARS